MKQRGPLFALTLIALAVLLGSCRNGAAEGSDPPAKEHLKPDDGADTRVADTVPDQAAVVADMTPAREWSRCRPIGAFSSVSSENEPVTVSARAIADGLGNFDGLMTGIETEIEEHLAQLAAGSRCWLGTRRRLADSGAPTKVDLWSVLQQTCAIDCGDEGLGLDDGQLPMLLTESCHGAFELRRTGAGWTLTGNAMAFLGERFDAVPIELLHDDSVPDGEAYDQVRDTILSEVKTSYSPSCADALETRAMVWEAEFSGGCDLSRLVMYDRWDKPGTEVRIEGCGESAPIRLAAALDVAAVRQCKATSSLAEFYRTMKVGDIYLTELADIDGVRGVWSTRTLDLTRFVETAESLEPGEESASGLLSAYSRVPLGLRSTSLLAVAENDRVATLDRVAETALKNLGRDDLANQRATGPLDSSEQPVWAHIPDGCRPGSD